jgi:hypothetical protein
LPRLPLGDTEPGNKSAQGDDYFVAPNPPFGAVFTYYLAEGLQTAKQQRREQEKEIAAEGGNTPFPGWNVIRAEDNEEEPVVVLTVHNAEGELVRRVEGPAAAGFHRVAWDLRYPETSPWQREPADDDFLETSGPLAAPGEYTVTIASRANGELTDLGMSQTFSVVPLRERGLKGADPDTVVAFSRELDDLRRQASAAETAITELLTEIEAIKSALARSLAPAELRQEAQRIQQRLLDLQLSLSGDPNRQLYNEGGPVPVSNRLSVALLGTMFSTYGPTPTHERSLEIGAQAFGPIRSTLDEINGRQLPALRQALDAAGVPWTPGRE